MPKNRRSRMLVTSLGGLCMLIGAPAMAANLHAVLQGSKEFTGGDPDGWARVKINIDDSANRLCADVETRSLEKVTGIHVYRGMPGDKSSPVISLEIPKGDNDSDDCDKIGDELADQIQASPSDFYVSVRTIDHPNGALAGKIMPGKYKG